MGEHILATAAAPALQGWDSTARELLGTCKGHELLYLSLALVRGTVLASRCCDKYQREGKGLL